MLGVKVLKIETGAERWVSSSCPGSWLGSNTHDIPLVNDAMPSGNLWWSSGLQLSWGLHEGGSHSLPGTGIPLHKSPQDNTGHQSSYLLEKQITP